MKRDPDCVARELEQASQWSLRVAERKRKESSHRENEKGSLGLKRRAFFALRRVRREIAVSRDERGIFLSLLTRPEMTTKGSF